MSTCLLYHAFGVRDYRYLKTEYTEGGGPCAVPEWPKSARLEVPKQRCRSFTGRLVQQAVMAAFFRLVCSL